MKKMLTALCLCSSLLLCACQSVSEPGDVSTPPETSITTALPETVTTIPETTPPEVTSPPVTTSTPPPSTTAESQEEEALPVMVQGVIVANKSYALPADYNPGVDKAAQTAFDVMQKAAAKEGLNIYISSSFRSYEYQVKLYERYVKQHGKAAADTFSARPGHSEHQTGLTFDLNTINDAFGDTAEAAWVAAHAHEYGFIVRYPEGKEDVTGYKYEPWHIRYLGVEIATSVYDSGLCLEEYLGITSEYED